MKNRASLLVFVLAFIVAVTVMAPAALLGELTRYFTQGHLSLVNTSGTLWKGSAGLALRAANGKNILLTPIHWEIAAPQAFPVALRFHFWGGGSAPDQMSVVSLSPGRVELFHTALSIPARDLGEVVSLMRAALLGGQLLVKSEHMAFSGEGMSGETVVDWHDASSELCSIAPLGEYEILVKGAGRVAAIELRTRSGVLALDGAGKWKADSGLEFHGVAHATGGGHDGLAELLQHLGPEVSPGVHAVTIARF